MDKIGYQFAGPGYIGKDCLPLKASALSAAKNDTVENSISRHCFKAIEARYEWGPNCFAPS